MNLCSDDLHKWFALRIVWHRILANMICKQMTQTESKAYVYQ